MVAGVAVPGLLVGGVILTAAVPIFKRTAQGISEERRLPVDFLDALAIVLMTAQGSFLVPAFVVGVIEGAEIVRASTARRPPRTGLDLLIPGERKALVERAGGAQWLPWGGLGRGDVVLVRAGDRLPVDGTVLDGRGLVDEQQLTGVAAPIQRREGHRVRATTLLVQGQLRVRATRTGEETVAAGLLAQAQRAPGSDTRISNYARRVGNPAVVPTLAVGAGVWATSGSVARAAGITGLDLGTGMRVSAPIAVRSAQAYAARHGVLIRSGRALEQLARVKAIVFDKTGTLTEGQARIVDVRAVASGVSSDDVLRLAAAPMGCSITPSPGPWPPTPGSAGSCLCAALPGRPSWARAWWRRSRGSECTSATAGCWRGRGSGSTPGGSETEGAPRGARRTYTSPGRAGWPASSPCRDLLRAESAGVVAELRRRGLASYLVTGDHAGVAGAGGGPGDPPPTRPSRRDATAEGGAGGGDPGSDRPGGGRR